MLSHPGSALRECGSANMLRRRSPPRVRGVKVRQARAHDRQPLRVVTQPGTTTTTTTSSTHRTLRLGRSATACCCCCCCCCCVAINLTLWEGDLNHLQEISPGKTLIERQEFRRPALRCRPSPSSCSSSCSCSRPAAVAAAAVATSAEEVRCVKDDSWELDVQVRCKPIGRLQGVYEPLPRCGSESVRLSSSRKYPCAKRNETKRNETKRRWWFLSMFVTRVPPSLSWPMTVFTKRLDRKTEERETRFAPSSAAAPPRPRSV